MAGKDQFGVMGKLQNLWWTIVVAVLIASMAVPLAGCQTSGTAALNDLRNQQEKTDIIEDRVSAESVSIVDKLDLAESLTTGDAHDAVVAAHSEAVALKENVVALVSSRAEEKKLTAKAIQKVAATETALASARVSEAKTSGQRNTLAAILIALGVVGLAGAGLWIAKKFGFHFGK